MFLASINESLVPTCLNDCIGCIGCIIFKLALFVCLSMVKNQFTGLEEVTIHQVVKHHLHKHSASHGNLLFVV